MLNDNFPSTKVKAYTLEEGHILRMVKGASSALSLRTNDGCIRVGRSSVIRVNKRPKHFETWEELQEAVKTPRVSTKSGRNEIVVVVRKGDLFPVAPTIEEENMGIEEAHQRLMQWCFLGFSAAMQRASKSATMAVNKILVAGTVGMALAAMILVGLMAIIFFSGGDASGTEETTNQVLDGMGVYVEPTPVATPGA